ncbi:MAG: DUF922 domain-containing protein [Bryobacteraceae bacterium]
MAGTKAKFNLKWTKTDNKTYAVPGNTYEEMFKFFEKKNAAKEEWGKFHPEIPHLSFKPTKDPITEVTLEVGYTIVMPSWSKASSIGQKEKAAWDTMMKALQRHEEQHRTIFEFEAEAFGTDLSFETDLSQKKLSDMFKKFPGDVRKAQQAYDSKTANGKNEGVFLPAPDKVKN